jgi:hypothetical protein
MTAKVRSAAVGSCGLAHGSELFAQSLSRGRHGNSAENFAGGALNEKQETAKVTKEAVGIHVLLKRSFLGGSIPRRLLLRVSLTKSTSVPVRF